MKKILWIILGTSTFVFLLWAAHLLGNNDRVKRNRRAMLIEFYKAQGREQIQLEAINLKFAIRVGDEFRWNTNVAELVERSYKAQKNAIEINEQTKELMDISIKTMQNAVRFGELVKTLNGDYENGKTKGQQKQEEQEGQEG